MTDPARAQSFGLAADQYDRLRPGYPAAALRWALGESPIRVVDLGAGTGILTRALTALGHEVIPVEPDPAMRARLTAAGGPPPRSGTAEAIPLPDASVDAVVAGQAYHWFDRARAHPEVARVLRPGGVFAPIWNHRDQSVPWVAALSRIADDKGKRGPDGTKEHGPDDTTGRGIGEPVYRVDTFGDEFGQVQRAAFTHATRQSVEGLVGLVSTRSYYLTASPARQRELVDRVTRLCAEHPDLAGRSEFPMPYHTLVYRATKSHR